MVAEGLGFFLVGVRDLTSVLSETYVKSLRLDVSSTKSTLNLGF